MKRFLLAAFLVVGVAHLALATTTDELKIKSGATTITILDNGVGDLNSSAGSILWSGSIDGWNISFAGGTSDSPSALPVGLDISSLTASCVSGGCTSDDLSISFSDINFTTPVGAGGFNSFYSATIVTGSTTQWAYDDTSNTVFGTGTPIGSVGPLTAPGGHGSVSGGGPAGPGAYSLTLTDVIQHGSNVNSVSVDGNLTAVPEPGALVLLGSALVLCAAGLRRRKAS